MDWCSFGANFGQLRALSKTPQNVAITVLLEENSVLNESLNKSVLFFVAGCSFRQTSERVDNDCQVYEKTFQSRNLV